MVRAGDHSKVQRPWQRSPGPIRRILTFSRPIRPTVRQAPGLLLGKVLPMPVDPPLISCFGHPEFESLVAAVAAPSDNAPRLVLSDWLRERGDEVGADWAGRPGFLALLAILRLAYIGTTTPDELTACLAELSGESMRGPGPCLPEPGSGVCAFGREPGTCTRGTTGSYPARGQETPAKVKSLTRPTITKEREGDMIATVHGFAVPPSRNRP